MTKTLIIGNGEVGKSLAQVLAPYHEVHIRDKNDEELGLEGIEVLNICYPPSPEFVEQTKKYIKKYKPKLTIIHSTVPIGTTRSLGKWVVHSPIHGKHPDLSAGIKTFVKYVGGAHPSAVYMATQFLGKAGINAKVVSSPEASELSKIMCTSYYGWNILFMKEVEKLCEKLNIDFSDVYTRWNWEYNYGYQKLNMSWFTRPVLDPMPGGIGGHCVVNNAKLLDSFITNTIVEKNNQYKKDE